MEIDFQFIGVELTSKKTFYNLPKDKQDRITTAALEEFGSKGYDGASINSMVERLNIAKGSIFQYFGDKKGLFLFVFERSMEMVKNHLRIVRDQSIDDPLETRLRKTLLTGIDFIRQHPLLYRMYLRMFFESRLPFREEIFLSLRGNSITFLGELLEDARNKGQVRLNIPIDRAAFMIDAVMDRFLQALTIPHLDAGLGIHRSDKNISDDWVDTLVDMLCRGISFPVQDKDNSPPYLLVTAAVRLELAPLLSRLEDLRSCHLSERTVIGGKLGGLQVRLLETGPGLINAVQAITAIIEHQRPGAVIMTGCGGAFEASGLKIGDIALADREIDAHSGVETGTGGPLAPLPFPVLDMPEGSCMNNTYGMDKPVLDKAWRILNRAFDGDTNTRVLFGPVLTVSTITATPETVERYQKQYAPLLEQMEGAGAAHVAHLYGIPFLEIRGVSNMAGNRDYSTWDIPLAAERACAAVYEVICGMGGDFLK